MSEPELSKYATSLEIHVKQRYLQKIEKIGVDPVNIPDEELDPECLPPIEQSDLFSFLVLETSYYTNDQFKNYKSLEAYNQVVSGFVASVKGKLVSEKHVVLAKVRHSQRMNDALVDIWIVAGQDGRIFSAHCLGCKAGLAESCSHIASALFYIECWTRINGKLACTQVKCTWLLPTYVSKVTYARAKDINFTSAKKLKENLDNKIESIDGEGGSFNKTQTVNTGEQKTKPAVSVDEMSQFFKKLNQCEEKASLLSLIEPYADQFISKSRNIPVVTDLYDPNNLHLNYPELLRKCLQVEINISEKEIETVEQDTRTQAKGPGFFRHRAGRIGASVCGAVYHTNLAQPSLSLIHSICYPHLFKLNNKAINHGCKYEEHAIKTYEQYMALHHLNFEMKRCGMFINKEFPYIHATPDFLVSCDCCGMGCGEVKCPISITNADFGEYSKKASSCLESVNQRLQLKRTHNYFYQVQQQLFTLPERRYSDFVVYSIDSEGNSHIVCDRIYPDPLHSKTVMQKLVMFWKICILPEVLGRWYTRRCDVGENFSTDSNAICFCKGKPSGKVITCGNAQCHYKQFHTTCLGLDDVSIPEQWYCPRCCKLPQFKRGRKAFKGKAVPSTINEAAMQCTTICVCNGKANITDRIIECHNADCDSGHFFHLSCLGLKRVPNNSKTTWQCFICRGKNTQRTSAQPTTCTSSALNQSPVASNVSSNSESEDEIEITKVSTGSIDKCGPLAVLGNSDYAIISDPVGWLTGDIIQSAQVLIKQVNPALEGLQRPILGRVRNFDVVSGEFVQILHTGSDHWVCVSSIGCQPGLVNLYDSLYHDVISQEIEEQTNDLLGGGLISLDFVPVQQQSNGSDCGVFSIAFATCLAFATNPSFVTFDVVRMRSHLLACLKNGRMSMFPSF